MRSPRLLASFRAAIGFLTILPVSPRDAAGALARAPAWFPAVGLLLGQCSPSWTWPCGRCTCPPS